VYERKDNNGIADKAVIISFSSPSSEARLLKQDSGFFHCHICKDYGLIKDVESKCPVV
jgi:hypothetical protein